MREISSEMPLKCNPCGTHHCQWSVKGGNEFHGKYFLYRDVVSKQGCNVWASIPKKCSVLLAGLQLDCYSERVRKMGIDLLRMSLWGYANSGHASRGLVAS